MYVDYIRPSKTKIMFLSVSFKPVFVLFDFVLYMLALLAVLIFLIVNLFNLIDVVSKIRVCMLLYCPGTLYGTSRYKFT